MMLSVWCNLANLMPCQICDLCAVYEEIGWGEIIKVYELPRHRWRPQGQTEGPQSSRGALLCVCVPVEFRRETARKNRGCRSHITQNASFYSLHKH